MPAFSTVQLIYATLLGATLITQVVIALWVYRYQWEQSGSTWFLIMVGTGSVWVFAYFLFVVLTLPTLQRVAHLVGHFGALLTISAFVVFASKYTEAGYHRNRLVQALLLAVCGSYLVLAPTNSAHGLIFAEFRAVSEPFQYQAAERGMGFWAMAIAIQVPAMYSIYRMATDLLSTQQRAGTQVTLFIIGALSISILDYIDQFTSLLPLPGFPNATLGMFIFYIVTGFALFRFNLLDVKPVARNTIIENLHDPVLVVEAQNRIIDHNDAAREVWPDIEEHVLDPFDEACPELADVIDIDSGTDAGTNLTTGSGTNAATDSETDPAMEVTLERDGVSRFYSVTVSGVSVRGESTGWNSIVLRDITELRESRDRLQAQNDRLNKVASTISHDLRNPISVATTHLELLGDKLDEEELLEHVEKTAKTHERMLEIIEDILTIAREGETVDETERIRLGAVAEEAWGNIDTAAASMDVAEDCYLDADRSKLLTIFENLFRNALDHGAADAHIKVGATDAGFHIQDDGPGIPPDKADDVFEFGYTTGSEGTGLGLSIVQTMVESHGWSVAVDPDYEAGARFDVSGVESVTAVADAEESAADADQGPTEATHWSERS